MCALGVVAVCNGLLAMIPFKLPKMNMMTDEEDDDDRGDSSRTSCDFEEDTLHES